jgi:two-component system, NarL family, sensor kinase
MSEQTARRLSWSISGLSFIVVMLGLGVSILALIVSDRGVTFSHQFFTPVLTITYGVVGALVASRHPRNPIGWIFCAIGFLSALNMLASGCAMYSELVMPIPGTGLARWLNRWVWVPNVALPLTFVLLMFPNGRLPSRRWLLVAWASALGIAIFTVSVALYPAPWSEMGLHLANPISIVGCEVVFNALIKVAALLVLIGIVGSTASIVVRFRRSEGVERTQLRVLAVTVTTVMMVGTLVGLLPWLIHPNDPVAQELSIVMTDLVVMAIVVATGVAILRYRLWDIHFIVNRTLVYGSLTALIVALYIVIVGTLGTLLQTGGNLPVSLFGTGIIAISFQPLRERLQRGVNRLMYGERDDPYAVLGRLSEQLEVVTASQSVLPTIVETVAEALKLPYVAISLKNGDQFKIAAEFVRSSAYAGTRDGIETLPLIYQLETIGQLIFAPRSSGESFSHADRGLLETIARQAGVAAYNVRLTLDLQRSRERLVTTREEERRRLRRDLHDGLGPVLAAMSFKLDAVYNLADRDAGAVKKMSTELKAQMQEVLADIRRIAYNLRPPALDELGLVGALKAHIASYNQVQGLQITLEAPENPPPLPAAVEVAAYRIALEAMTNVSRHAGARHCCVRLSLPDDLCLEVTDDGSGLPKKVQAGVGLTSMRERAEELGGVCIAEVLPQGGTGITAHLPLSSEYIAAAGG